MYNKHTDSLFFDLIKIKKDTRSLQEIFLILKALLYSHGLPKSSWDRLKPFKYSGDSFILNPHIFLKSKYDNRFKLEALDIASLRNYTDFTLYNKIAVNKVLVPTDRLILKLNPLLEIKNDNIYIKTGNIWH
jgi:hypothetical protein